MWRNNWYWTCHNRSSRHLWTRLSSFAISAPSSPPLLIKLPSPQYPSNQPFHAPKSAGPYRHLTTPEPQLLCLLGDFHKINSPYSPSSSAWPFQVSRTSSPQIHPPSLHFRCHRTPSWCRTSASASWLWRGAGRWSFVLDMLMAARSALAYEAVPWCLLGASFEAIELNRPFPGFYLLVG